MARPAASAATEAGPYRPDIDGLRAVAVVPVIAFHAFPHALPGGFVGVDVFFVVSGFLITTIIVRDLEAGRFAFVDFYARRAKRILPALVVVLVAVLVAGWAMLFADEYRGLGKQVAGGAAFVSNFVLLEDAGYFDATAATKPLLHLWSLAIEEQFYLAWPLILVAAHRRVPRALVVAAVAALSFAFGAHLLVDEPARAFYSPFARAWELMVGAALAEVMRSRPSWFDRLATARSLAGCALIVVAVSGIAGTVPFPGWRALLPTAGAALYLSAGGSGLGNRVLSSRGAVAIGRISYPLYLWHWPLLSFVYIDASEALATGAARFGCIAAAIVLAAATYRWVERPLRRRTDLRRIPLGLVAALAVAGAAGVAIRAADGFPFRLGDREAWVARFDETRPEMRYRTAHDIPALYREECNFYDYDAWRAGRGTNVARAAIDPSCTARPAGASQVVFLWGDSHAEHLSPGLRATLPSDVAVLQVASSGCPAALVPADDRNPNWCRTSNREAMAAIRRVRPDVVVVAQRGAHRIDRLRTIATALHDAGVPRVVVVGPIPQWTPVLPKVVARDEWPRPPHRSKDHLDPDIVADERALAGSMRPDEPFAYVDLFAALCDDRGCLVDVDGDRDEGLVTFDYGHLTPRASTWLARTLLAPAILRTQPPPAASTRR